MDEVIQFIATGLLFIAVILIPAAFVAKIRYYKATRQRVFRGGAEFFLPVSREWWIAALTWWLPILGKSKTAELEDLRRKANFRVYVFYTILFTVAMVLGI